MDRLGYGWLLAACACMLSGCSDRAAEAARKTSSLSASTRDEAPQSLNAAISTEATTEEIDPAAPNSQPHERATAKLRNEALALLGAGDFEEAWRRIQSAMVRDGQNPETLFVAARITAARGNRVNAVRLLEQIPEDDPRGGLPALGQAAEWLTQLGDLRGAESKLLRMLKANSKIVAARRLLVRIYNAQARRWETRPQLMELIAAGDFRFEELLMLIDLSEPFEAPELREAADRRTPNDPYGALSRARRLLYKNHFDDAEPLLRQAVQALPQAIEPWVWLGHLLVATEKHSDLMDWQLQAPEGHDSHPGYWLVRGRWADASEESKGAARCFAEAVRLDPLSPGATQRLAAALTQIGHSEAAEALRTRGRRMTDISTLAQELLRGASGSDAHTRIAEEYAALGEPMLSIAWRTLGKISENRQQALAEFAAERKLLARADASLVEGNSEVIDVILRDLPWQEWTWTDSPHPRPPRSRREASDPVHAGSPLAFRDVAAERGIDARYDNGGNVDRPGLLIFQGNGGGVGVLDFDLDGWMDFYFSNAGGKPAEPHGHKPKFLYRSHQGSRFVETTASARLMDVGYGQGIAVGDVDQDGFPDVLAMNFGITRLYHNAGDGTFEEWPIPQPPDDESWLTSAAIADLDGDGLPDLALGGYIAGQEVRTKACGTPNTDAKNCHPNEFPPCPNPLLRNSGDGCWQRWGGELAESVREGRTLGALATNLDGVAGNDVFFTNDVSPNFLLLSQDDAQRRSWTLDEQASRRGVAVDAGGRAQAHMGIACGDVDRNGLLDLAVTTFLYDTNTLYLQTSPGMWIDGTRRSRMHVDSLDFLGFGCQFLDADNDGWLDFAVSNGHIDDYRQLGRPYRMLPQIFRNARGTFVWSKSPSVGSYFQQPVLGRSLAQVDFDRDHRIDLVATHLDRPAALLHNQSDSAGNFLELELVGTQSEREAVGALVRITAENESWLSPMTAGDGYLSSNQKLIHIGLGSVRRIDQATIQWPSGQWQTLTGLQANRRYLVVEGREAWER